MDLNNNNKGDFEEVGMETPQTTPQEPKNPFEKSVDLQLEPGAFVPNHVRYNEPEQREVYQAPPPPPFYPPQNTGAYPPSNPLPEQYGYNQQPQQNPTNIYFQNMQPGPYVSPLSKTTALILCILGFIGFGGIHYFYSGKIGMGLLYFFTGGLCGIGTIIDTINIASGNFRDQYGYFIVN